MSEEPKIRTKVMEALRNKDERPQRGFWAPGDYINECLKCGVGFTGDKRALNCAACAYGDNVKSAIPKALFSCCVGGCCDEYSWPAADLHWSDEINGWMCGECWDDHAPDERFGVTLENYLLQNDVSVADLLNGK